MLADYQVIFEPTLSISTRQTNEKILMKSTVDSYLSKCLLLDLEVGKNGKIFQIGAVYGDQEFERKDQRIDQSTLAELDHFADEAEILMGHNLLGHDLLILREQFPQLALLKKPVVDTLYLSPLAFPENPYHHLVKDYKLVKDSINSPVKDAHLAGRVFKDQWESFQQTDNENPDLLNFFFFCFSQHLKLYFTDHGGLSSVFNHWGKSPTVTLDDSLAIFIHQGLNYACPQALEKTGLQYLPTESASILAYCLAWLRISGGNSVIPPWVRHRFSEIPLIIKQLRNTPCGRYDCEFCSNNHSPEKKLKQYFNFDTFRDEPKAEDDTSLQRNIVLSGMQDQSILAILPTGGGKSLCFQLPALIRNQRTGQLTIIISPLQALMKDQVDNLGTLTGTISTGAIYGMLTPPERGEIMSRVRFGDIAILYLSPEQLRNQSVRTVISQREIGCWVFDEAHCLSKWGHDFRPDYLYVSRFIKEFAEEFNQPVPPIACFTATAKLDVIKEIIDHFRENLGQTIQLFQSSVERDNLNFEVQPITSGEKFDRIDQILTERLPADEGSAVIYTATKKAAEEISDFLGENGHNSTFFHAGIDAAIKRDILDQFVNGEVRIICATNAFGMGIDKEDVRLVIHADIPGSLENYLQEAGRAGRDLKDAECILLYNESDMESQFRLEKNSELSQKDITHILRGLRKSKRTRENEVVITAGELLRNEDLNVSFDSKESTADTKVKIAIAWLERAGYLERNQNQTWVFQGKPTVLDMVAARKKISQLNLQPQQEQTWIKIMGEIFNSKPDSGISADHVAEEAFPYETKSDVHTTQLSLTHSQQVFKILQQMVSAGLLEEGVLLSAYIKNKGARSSQKLLKELCFLENALIKLMQEEDPDSENGEWVDLHLIKISQSLKTQGYENTPQTIRLLLKCLSLDGKGLAGRKGSLIIKPISKERFRIKLQRNWKSLIETTRRRHIASEIILTTLQQKISSTGSNPEQVQVEFSCNDLIDHLKADTELGGIIEDYLALVDRCLTYLHDQKIITLQNGLAVFRQAMRINLLPQNQKKRYNKGDYQPLSHHYQERIFQIHVMGEYARLGMEKFKQALKLVLDYFTIDKQSFFRKYFAGREAELMNPTLIETHQKIVENLNNQQQQEIVTSSLDENALILAGPGSGKTRVIVHRCAYLLSVERVDPTSILILCFNRNAAIALKKRLFDLVGKDARRVTVLTYHSLAMKLAGRSFAVDSTQFRPDEINFDELIQDAVELLTGKVQILGIEADDQRDSLLSGYQFILIDEYQDIDQVQYNLISAITGRKLADIDEKISIMAVGDDDQNIYSFRGANVKYIRKFQEDYQVQKSNKKTAVFKAVKLYHMVENYRSSGHIIQAANALIKNNRDRMKTDFPIQIDQKRKDRSPGDHWTQYDPISKGRVQVMEMGTQAEQATVIIDEIERFRQLDTALEWSDFAVLSRIKADLPTLRVHCEKRNIPVAWTMDKKNSPPLHRIREIDSFLTDLKQKPKAIKSGSELLEKFRSNKTVDHQNVWHQLTVEILKDHMTNTQDGRLPVQFFIDYLYETLAEYRKETKIGNGIFLSTVHSAKGMEFPHVFITDSGWDYSNNKNSSEEERRLFYVAMTRAKQTLSLIKNNSKFHPHLNRLDGAFLTTRTAKYRAESTEDNLNICYELLGLKDIFLGFAGGFSKNSDIHRNLAKLQMGDKVSFQVNESEIFIQDQSRNIIAKLSKSACTQWRDKIPRLKKATVFAMITRYREDEERAYQRFIRTDKWELPMIEVVVLSNS